MTGADTAMAARFLLVHDLPLVVVDVDAGLLERLLERGLAVLPRFLGQDLPKGARVGFTVAREELTLEDDAGTALLRVSRAALEPAWTQRALALRGTVLVAGRGLGIGPDQTGLEVAETVEAGCGERRVAAAVVGVAEPRVGLPLLFG